MAVLTSTLYCTAGCKKVPHLWSPGKRSIMQNLLHLLAAVLFLHLETPSSFLSEKASPPSLYPSGTAWPRAPPRRGWEGHDFPTLELLPMAAAVCPSHAGGAQGSRGASRQTAIRQPPQAALLCRISNRLHSTQLTLPRAQKPEWPPIPLTKTSTWISVNPKQS